MNIKAFQRIFWSVVNDLTLSPLAPCMPVSPRSPLSPWGPFSPRNPWGPAGPVSPFSPGGPILLTPKPLPRTDS